MSALFDISQLLVSLDTNLLRHECLFLKWLDMRLLRRLGGFFDGGRRHFEVAFGHMDCILLGNVIGG